MVEIDPQTRANAAADYDAQVRTPNSLLAAIRAAASVCESRKRSQPAAHVLRQLQGRK